MLKYCHCIVKDSISESRPAGGPAGRSPLASGVLGAVGGRHDVLAGDERAATPVLAAALAVQIDGGHPGPLAGPRHVPAHHPELGRLGHAAGWPAGNQGSQVRSGLMERPTQEISVIVSDLLALIL